MSESKKILENSWNSSRATTFESETFQINEFLLEKFIAMNPLYYIDEEEEFESRQNFCGFSNGGKEYYKKK